MYHNLESIVSMKRVAIFVLASYHGGPQILFHSNDQFLPFLAYIHAS